MELTKDQFDNWKGSQITREVERASHGKTEVKGVFKLGGDIHLPEDILKEIERS